MNSWICNLFLVFWKEYNSNPSDSSGNLKSCIGWSSWEENQHCGLCSSKNSIIKNQNKRTKVGNISHYFKKKEEEEDINQTAVLLHIWIYFIHIEEPPVWTPKTSGVGKFFNGTMQFVENKTSQSKFHHSTLLNFR